jgi:hypothetical protein
MAIGPGKYDDLCTYVREKAQADGAIVIVLGGEDGGGFACQASPAMTAELERMADQIRADLVRDSVLRTAWWDQLSATDREFWKARARSNQIEDAWATFIGRNGRFPG